MSDMTTAQAAAEAGKWGNLIRALSRLTETAEFLQAQEGLKGERKKHLEKLQKEIDGLEKERDAAKAAAESLLADATAAAKKVEAHAAAEYQRVMAEVSAARAALNTLKSEAAAALDTRTSAYEDVKKARADLAAVQKQIAEAKADAVRRFGS